MSKNGKAVQIAVHVKVNIDGITNWLLNLTIVENGLMNRIEFCFNSTIVWATSGPKSPSNWKAERTIASRTIFIQP